MKSKNLFLSPSRSDFVVLSSLFFGGILVVRSTSWAWFQGLFFFNLRDIIGFQTFGVEKLKDGNTNEVGQMLVSGTLVDTRTMRKFGADVSHVFG